MTAHRTIRIGLISDTHGHLPPETAAIFRGADHILHAGDIGAPEVLAELRRIAPVAAVAGNTDRSVPALTLPHSDTLEWQGVRVHLLHDTEQLELRPGAAGIRVVIAGHTHRPGIRMRGDILHVNPGSASRPRNPEGATVGELFIAADRITARILLLDQGATATNRVLMEKSLPI